MPEQLNRVQYTREDVDAYHEAVLHVVRIVRSWDPDDYELQEFLDHDKNHLLEPKPFTRFRKAWQRAMLKGRKVRIFQQTLKPEALKFVAREMWSSNARMRCYDGQLESKLRCASSDVEPISVKELEQHYQYYLCNKGRKQLGEEKGLPFRVWQHTPDCATFYDSLIF